MSVRGYVAAIAGLRALAVLSIVAYHLNAHWLPGGFVGVDVFFVISGFVVAHSVAGKPHETFGSYLAWFYKRRFQRILPAAFFYIVVAATLSLLFVPIFATKFMEITGAAASFAFSNVILWLKEGDYFAASSELNLFTHTWSLAVEEQYYLFFPFFSYPLFASTKAGPTARRAALIFVVSACIVSLIAAAWLSTTNPTFAFYMLPTRFWELGMGFLVRVALTEQRTAWLADRTLKVVHILALGALIALVSSFIWTSPRNFPFPGAILPCTAAALLIAIVWCHPGVWLDRMLSNPVSVWFGNISYSLYLWHWGVIVIMRWTVGIDTLPLQLAALALILLLAQLSYRYVENPFHNARQRRTPPSAGLFLGYGVSASAVAALCIACYILKPTLGLASSDRVAMGDPYSAPPIPANCPTSKSVQALGGGLLISFPADCTKAGSPTLFILGDSHAGAYQRAAWRIAATGKYRVELMTLGGCSPVSLTVPTRTVAECPAFRQLATNHLREHVKLGDVIFLPSLQTTRYRSTDGEPLPPRAIDEVRLAQTRERLRELANLGSIVVIEGAKPVAPNTLYRSVDWFNRMNPACRLTIDYAPAETSRRMAIAQAGLDRAADGIPRVVMWEPKATLCNEQGCPSFMDGKPLYFDTDHLSAHANDILLPSLLSAIDAASLGASKAGRLARPIVDPDNHRGVKRLR